MTNSTSAATARRAAPKIELVAVMQQFTNRRSGLRMRRVIRYRSGTFGKWTLGVSARRPQREAIGVVNQPPSLNDEDVSEAGGNGARRRHVLKGVSEACAFEGRRGARSNAPVRNKSRQLADL